MGRAVMAELGRAVMAELGRAVVAELGRAVKSSCEFVSWSVCLGRKSNGPHRHGDDLWWTFRAE